MIPDEGLGHPPTVNESCIYLDSPLAFHSSLPNDTCWRRSIFNSVLSRSDRVHLVCNIFSGLIHCFPQSTRSQKRGVEGRTRQRYHLTYQGKPIHAEGTNLSFRRFVDGVNVQREASRWLLQSPLQLMLRQKMGRSL
jgi:hypothetical protein